MNNQMNDFATALTASIANDGQTPITADIPMNGNKLTGLAAATANGDAVSLSFGTFTGTLTGFTTSPTVTVSWVRMGNFVVMRIPPDGAGLSTSNSVNFKITGGPSALGCSDPAYVSGGANAGCLSTQMAAYDNGTSTTMSAYVDSAGTINFYQVGHTISNGGWTNSGLKGYGEYAFPSGRSGIVFSYLIY